MHIKKERWRRIKIYPLHLGLNHTALPLIIWYTIYVYHNKSINIGTLYANIALFDYGKVAS